MCLFPHRHIDAARFICRQPRSPAARRVIDAFPKQNRVRARGEQEDDVARAAEAVDADDGHSGRGTDMVGVSSAFLGEADPAHDT